MATLPAAPLANTVPVPPFFGALLRRPPHDPLSYLLNARVGWRAATLDGVEIQRGSGAVALAAAPCTGRSPCERSGSLGGVTLPANLAQAPECAFLLLDHRDLKLKRFDACTCAFVEVPCYGGKGAGPRQLDGATAIAVCSGNLFICDLGNHRIVLLSLRGFVLRTFWAPPPSANLSHSFEPLDIAFDGKGRAYVADSGNNAVQVFAPSGEWLRSIVMAGLPRFVAVDCCNRLYVILEGETVAHVFDFQSGITSQFSRPQDMAGCFPPVPMPTNSRGDIDMSDVCCLPVGSAWFTPDGDAMSVPPPPEPPQYTKGGRYISEPLDSWLYQCQWHRIVIEGTAPRGSRVVVSTYTAEADIPQAMIEDLPDSAWATSQAFRSVEKSWDCMITSGPGRFLWVRLQFIGNGSVTSAIASMTVEYPRISLRRLLPAVFSEDPTLTGFVDRFLAVFDTTMRSIEGEVDDQAKYFDPMSAPATPAAPGGIDFLSWLASWLGLQLDRAIPEDRRRAMVAAAAGRISPISGTREGLRRALLLFLGLSPRSQCCEVAPPAGKCCPPPLNCRSAPPCEYNWEDPPLILEHYQIRRWLFVGFGKLSDQSQLWSEQIVGRTHLNHYAKVGTSSLNTVPDPVRDPFLAYAHQFSVFVPEKYGNDLGQKRALMNLLSTESPAHTKWRVKYVGPRFRIGVQSMIGLDSVVGKYPAGVQLGGTKLGPASVLDAPPWAQGGPSMTVADTRIGSTSKLE